MVDSEDFHVGWIKKPGSDWKSNPGEPTTVPNEIDIDGVHHVWNVEHGEWRPVDPAGEGGTE